MLFVLDKQALPIWKIDVTQSFLIPFHFAPY